MPYSIKTKDGIIINDIPDDVAKDSDVLKNRVAEIRKQREAPAPTPVSQPSRLGAEGGLLAGQIPGRSIPLPPPQVMATAAEVGLPAVGQVAGAATGPAAPVMVPALGGLGGLLGYISGSAIRGEAPKLGPALGATVSGGVPGSPLSGTGMRVLGREAVKQSAANIAAMALDRGVDENGAPRVTKEDVAMAVAGGVLAPFIGKMFDTGAAAKAAQEEISKISPGLKTLQKIEQAGASIPAPSKALPTKIESDIITLAKKDTGIAQNIPLSPKAIEDKLSELYTPYEQVSELVPNGKENIRLMKEARDEARKLWKRVNMLEKSNTPSNEVKALASEWQQLADSYEEDIIKAASFAGKKKLAEQLVQNKKAIAKVHLLDRALDIDRGTVDPGVYWKAREYGSYLDKEADVIASIYGANQDKEVKRSLMRGERAMVLKGLQNFVNLPEIADAVAESAIGLKVRQAAPLYMARPDMASDLARFATLQESRKLKTKENKK